MKKLCFFLSMTLLLLLLASCGGRVETVTVAVLSEEAPAMREVKAQPAEVLTEEKVNAYFDHIDTAIGWYVIRLPDDMNGEAKLVLYESLGYDGHCFFNGSSGFLTGYSYGEFGSGLIYRSYTSVPLDGLPLEEHDLHDAIDVELVSDDDCIALLSADYSKTEFCYAITSPHGWDSNNVSTIWKLTFPTSDHGKDAESEAEASDDATTEVVKQPMIGKERIMNFPEGEWIYEATIERGGDDPTMYLLTSVTEGSHRFYAVKTDGTYTEIPMPEHWKALYFNSIAWRDGSVFIGSAYGILEYRIAEETYWWYEYDFPGVDLNIE